MRFATLAAAALLTGAALPAEASVAVIVQSLGLSIENPRYIQKFNPNFGTLTHIVATATVYGGASYILGTRPVAGPIVVTSAGSAGILTNFGGPATIPLNIQVSGTVTYPPGTFYLGANGIGTGSVTFTEGLQNFIGVGTLSYYTFGALNPQFTDDNGIFYPSVIQPHSNPWGGSMVVEYYYENGAVPEPATWAMMIAGFGLVGRAMRRSGAATSRFGSHFRTFRSGSRKLVHRQSPRSA